MRMARSIPFSHEGVVCDLGFGIGLGWRIPPRYALYAMRQITPTPPPKHLNPHARELLEALAGHPGAAEIVLGGGVALSHYLEYRPTVDLDAWWRDAASAETRRLAEDAMKALATRHGLEFRLRKWGETESYELLNQGRKIFSFQISTRTRYIDEPLPASWAPVQIESLRDNAASKMTALVERGAPRDLLDVYELCNRGMLTVGECWNLWAEKNPGADPHEGRDKVLFHVKRVLDASVYPDMDVPPEELRSDEEKADYLQRICSAFDFGIFPEREDWQRLSEWRDIRPLSAAAFACLSHLPGALRLAGRAGHRPWAHARMEDRRSA